VKLQTLTPTLFAIAVLTAGCKPASDPAATEARDATTRQIDRVQQDTQASTRELSDYTYGQKAEFVTSMEAELAQLNEELDQLAAKIEKSSDAAKAEASPKLQALREQVAKLETHLEEAKNATESTWDNVKVAFKSGYAELKDGFNQARQWVSEKIAP
jgi:cytochrome c556